MECLVKWVDCFIKGSYSGRVYSGRVPLVEAMGEWRVHFRTDRDVIYGTWGGRGVVW